MFKIVVKEWGIILKSYDMIDLWKLMVSNPDFDFKFWKGYMPLTNSEFLKTFLSETNAYREYVDLYRILNKPISIFEYHETTSV